MKHDKGKVAITKGGAPNHSLSVSKGKKGSRGERMPASRGNKLRSEGGSELSKKNGSCYPQSMAKESGLSKPNK